MQTKKSHKSPRFVNDNTIRFCGRTFGHPDLQKLNNGTVYVAYDTYMDATIDVTNANGQVFFSLENREVA